ncbi:hypothetical protein D5018_09290 [Parashewanella curva]|uniref:Protein-tyrosine-phosphatase n=1 Tax=Parashewanella curva TaxID=2338552 RepID=A0A3L8PZM3_9GAMM|nr:protein-tyrosine phosphatase family protein [Parashewanella curva]RLV59988.1 hypothetical protein D5018_09290 [Parashewanella curva]
MASRVPPNLTPLTERLDSADEPSQRDEKLFEHDVNQCSEQNESHAGLVKYHRQNSEEPEFKSLQLPLTTEDMVGSDLFKNYKTSGGAKNFEPTQPRIKVLFENLTDVTSYLVRQASGEREQLEVCLPNPPFARFTDISCSLKTHVILNSVDGFDIKQNAMHSNYVDLLDQQKHIATQYPINKEEAAHFWLMAMQNNTDIIIDLTQKGDKDCVPYYPLPKNVKAKATRKEREKAMDSQVAFSFGVKPKNAHDEIDQPSNKDHKVSPELIVKLATEPTESKVRSTSVYKVTFNREVKLIRRFHCKIWRDHGAVSTEEFDELIKELAKYKYQNFIIHCRAGVGRTMTLCAGLELHRKFENGEINRENYQEIVFKTVMKLRYQRGPSSVQTQNQFELIMRTVYLWVVEAEKNSLTNSKKKK